MLYRAPVSSVPRRLAYSGICAWNALPTKNDEAPASTIIVMIRGSRRALVNAPAIPAKPNDLALPGPSAWPVYGARPTKMLNGT